LLIPAAPAQAQGTVADYVQAITLRDKYQALAVNVPEQVQWIRNTNRFWYRKTVPGGNAFVLVNADTQTKEPAFDHVKLAVKNQIPKDSGRSAPSSTLTRRNGRSGSVQAACTQARIRTSFTSIASTSTAPA
jgi:hypothetical protein